MIEDTYQSFYECRTLDWLPLVMDVIMIIKAIVLIVMSIQGLRWWRVASR